MTYQRKEVLAEGVELYLGDCLEVLRALPDASVDSCVTDPPYGLEFMGKEWDAPWKGDRRQTFDGSMKDERKSPYARSKVRYGQGDSYRADKANSKLLQEWHEKWAGEVLRVLKPGAHLLAFSGTRTYHRMACAIEDAGFEIRDQIGWAYGSGFPKSHNLDGDWEGWGTALKPAWEPICVARKPLAEKTVAANVLAHGTGGINIDACRIETKEDNRRPSSGGDNGLSGTSTFKIRARSIDEKPEGLGRWPANLIHDGSDEVLALFPHTKSGTGAVKKETGAGYKANAYGAESRAPGTPNIEYGDEGSAARFFYCAKASKADRGEGNTHPTVKPTDLMRYLCKLVTPPGGTVLDPFLGSGSTGRGAKLEGFGFIGIELNPEYVEIAIRRIEDALRRPDLFIPQPAPKPTQGSLLP